MPQTSRLIARRTSLLYLLFGIVWILFSDWFLSVLGLESGKSAHWQTLKGVAFVGGTALLLHLVLSRQLRQAGEVARERGRAEQVLRESEQRYRDLVRVSPEAIFLNQDNRIILINEAGLKLLRTSRMEEVLGRPPLDFFHPDCHGLIRERIAALLKSPCSVPLVEERMLALDGTEIPVEVAAASFHSGGRLVIQVICRDITAHKRAEARILELNAELERRVAERTAQLDARNKELEQFTYSVSHDLKAPLRGIDGYSRLLVEDCLEKLDDEGRRYVENIRRGARQMNQLIDDLLAYSKLERRRMNVGPLNPRRLVNAVIEERQHDLKGVELTIDVGEDEVAADAEGLATALRNLVDNAVKFSARRTPPVIEIRAQTAGDRWILSVRDNGAGFDMKFHDRIFHIFQRLHRAEDYEGTGIGLAIVAKVMERMGGRVRAEGQPDRGTVFYLDLPRTAENIGSGYGQEDTEHHP